MAYNNRETHLAVNMAEQTLQQNQIPFDIIFDQQADLFNKYYVIVLAGQESLSDKILQPLKTFAGNGGGLVITGNTGIYDDWRRLRQPDMLSAMIPEQMTEEPARNVLAFDYGKGRVIFLPDLERPSGEVRLGYSTRWMVPQNAAELVSAVYWAAGKRLPVEVTGPGWLGISHDTQETRDIIHMFNYNSERKIAGVIIKYDGIVRKAWTLSPGEKETTVVPFTETGGITELRIPSVDVYKLLILEKK